MSESAVFEGQQQEQQEQEIVQVDEEWQELHDQLCGSAEEIRRLLEKEKLDAAERASAEKELIRLEKLRRQLEEMARLEAAARAAAEAKLERERKRQAIITKLRSIGRCPAGFNWIPEGNGFRCGGGSHTVSYAQAGTTKDEARQYF